MILNPLPFWGKPSITNKFFQIDIELINFCANKCIFCCVKKDAKEKRIMSMADLELVLKQFPEYEIDVNLTDTGDSLLVDDLPDKIKLIKQYWPKCNLHLNTTLAIKRDKEYLHALFENGLNCMSISCYAFTPDDYLWLHGSKNYAIVIDNLVKLSCMKPIFREKVRLKRMTNISFYYPMDDYEQKEKRFLDKFRELGFNNFLDRYFLSVNDDKHIDVQCAYNLPIPCNYLYGFSSGMCSIRANLDIVPCCLTPDLENAYGNLNQNSLDEIYNGDKARKFRELMWKMKIDKIPVCNKCKYYGTGVSNDKELERIISWQGKQLSGKKVLFFGNGEAYRYYRQFFSETIPVGIIIDNYYKDKNEDEIPVLSSDVLGREEYKYLPLVIFAFQDISSKLLEMIYQKYHKPTAEIYVCPPNYVRATPKGPVFYDIPKRVHE